MWWVVKYTWAVLFDPHHGWDLAIAVDQLANTTFNGSVDETISSRAERHSRHDSNRECWAVILCKLLDHLDKDHCEKSKGQ